MGVEINAFGLLEGLAQLINTVPQRIQSGAESVSRQMEWQAKRNAPWTDRTGNARRTMTGFAGWDEGGNLLVGISGHMPYSPKLELRYGRRYAILVPTVDAYAPTILDAVARAVTAQGGIDIE